MSRGTDLPMRQPDEASRARGMYLLMFAPVFGPFFWGKLLSASGIWIHNIVAAIVAFQVSGSALVVGAVSAVQFAPQLLFAPLSGKMADRGDPARQIVLGRFLTGLGSGGLAAWIWAVGGVQHLSSALPVVAASLVVGIGFVVGGPAMHSIVPSMIRPGEMAAAMALNGVPMIVARAAGPALGALVATQLGPETAFAIAAATSILYGAIVLALRLPAREEHDSEADFSVRASLRHLRSDPPLLALLLGMAAVGIGAEPSITLAPALGDKLGGGTELVGWLTSAFGMGAGFAFLLFTPLQRWLGIARLSAGGLLLLATGLVLASLAGSPALVLPSFGLSGVGMMLAYTSITTQVQDRVPDFLRGRIMALWLVGFLGSRPLAAGLGGFLTDAASVGVALVVTAGVVAVAAYLCRPSRLALPVPA